MGFYFRPPIASSAYAGTFDPNLLPVLTVRVCPIDAVGACTGPDVVYDQASTPAITLDLSAENYALRWPPAAAGDFRARVYSGSTLLGFADIRVFEPGTGKKVTPADYTGVMLPASLNIRFRVETGTVAAVIVTPALAVLVAGATQLYTAVATDLYGAPIAGAPIAWSSSNVSAAAVSATGLVTGVGEGDATITASSGGVSGTGEAIVIGNPNAVVGVSTKFVPRADACTNGAGRTCESIIGDVVADAMRATYGVDFAITNSGGLRRDLTCPTVDDATDFCPPYTPLPYPITRGQVLAVMPFGNRVTTLTLNGAELKTMLENGVQMMPGVDGRFPQVSGLCFTYDISAPPMARVAGAKRQAPDGSCTGAPVDLTAVGLYTLASNNFMTTGGDGYPVFTPRVTVHDVMDRITSAYITSRSPISPATQGRITCISTGGTACPVVTPQ